MRLAFGFVACLAAAVSTWVVRSITASAVVSVMISKRDWVRKVSTILPRGGKLDMLTPASNNKNKVNNNKKFAEDNHMPSLFNQDEEFFDKYAACLAATEGLRRIRDRDLAEKDELAKNGELSKPLEVWQKQIHAQYIQNSAKILRALGMTVSQFNEFGRVIAKDESLKQRVVEQAYLYRMAATIHMDRSALDEDSTTLKALGVVPRDKIKMFCESMNEIEQLRIQQMERLKQYLHVEKMPANASISDPLLAPFLSPKVRAVVQAFPFQAEEIVKKHGLQCDEFNQMLAETHSNPIFRWKIQREIKAAGGIGRPESDGPTPVLSKQ